VHPFLARNFPVKAVIPIRGPRPAAADLVLLDLSHTPTVAISDLLDQASCQTVQAAWEDAVLKLLLIADVQFQLPTASPLTQIREHEPCCDIPTCPVCLHRIAPWRLGLNAPLRNGQMCSKYCPPPNLLPSRIREPTISCPRQRLVLSWPPPAHCSAYAVIDSYWRKQEDERSVAKEDDLFCFSCAMQQTLWVCLTCAFVGCGRYSNKHAADHYRQSGHPFCLELSTLRIWDYVVGEYAHRVDLLECPFSPPLMHPWIPTDFASRGASYACSSHESPDGFELRDQQHASSYRSHRAENYQDQYLDTSSLLKHPYIDEKSPKKATLIGEEYEALLQSALRNKLSITNARVYGYEQCLQRSR
jgi:hypothetical protein